MKLRSIFKKKKEQPAFGAGPFPSEQAGLLELPTEGDPSVRGLSDLYSPDPGPEPQSQVHDIADILQEMGKITEEQYARLRQHQASNPDCDSVAWLITPAGTEQAGDGSQGATT